MKKVIFVSALAVLGLAGQAQVVFGVKAGLNISNWTGSDADGAKSLLGFNGGATVQIPVSTMFSVVGEAVVSAEGTKFEEGGEELKYQTTYVNVPVMLQYNQGGFFAHAGPQIGFLVAAKAKGGGESVDIKDQLKSTAVSIAFGLGYRMANGFGFNARYNIGMSKIVDADDVDIKGSTAQIGVSYNFGGAAASND